MQISLSILQHRDIIPNTIFKRELWFITELLARCTQIKPAPSAHIRLFEFGETSPNFDISIRQNLAHGHSNFRGAMHRARANIEGPLCKSGRGNIERLK